MIRDGFVTQEEYDCIKNFHTALETYKEPNDVYDHQAILHDPLWQNIVSLGKKSINKLAVVLTDTQEKNALLEKPSALTEKDFTWPNS